MELIADGDREIALWQLFQESISELKLNIAFLRDSWVRKKLWQSAEFMKRLDVKRNQCWIRD